MGERMEDETLRLAHEEIVRLRDAQSGRIASVRARSSGVLGAAGIAASLVTALGGNPWYVLALIGFVFAAIYAVKSMRLKVYRATHPLGVLHIVTAKRAFDARAAIVSEIVKEYRRSEKALAEVVDDTKTALGWFVTGVCMTLLVSVVSALLSSGMGR